MHRIPRHRTSGLRPAFAALVAAGAVVAGLSPAAAAAAARATYSADCSYPYVCFYSSYTTKTGQFEDTGYWQTLTSSRGAFLVENTRKDNVALLRFTNGKQRCVVPRGSGYPSDVGTVSQIYISTSSTCPSGYPILGS
ncbi:hypothetical protein [Streptomyces sennicomposti]